MKYATDKLREVVANMPSSAREVAPDQYEWYTPSFQNSWIGSAINRESRWVAKGNYSTKNLSVKEDRKNMVDPEVKKLIDQALDKHEN